jgi:ferredoxin
MPKISFVKNQKPLDVPKDSNLMDVLMEFGVPVASSCGGQAVCTKCLVKVIEGKENLSPETSDEAAKPKFWETSQSTQLTGNPDSSGHTRTSKLYKILINVT